MGKLFYIMGKSASGKDKIYKYLMEGKNIPLCNLVLYTTRPIRNGEEEGKQYHFVDNDKYKVFMKEGRIIESRSYDTVHGVWNYFTVDDGKMDLSQDNYLGIGTLESYDKIRKYYGEDKVCPIYVEVEDGERLKRAIKREEKQEVPKYAELCRRFLADSADFSEEKIKNAGIKYKFVNDDLTECISQIEDYMKNVLY